LPSVLLQQEQTHFQPVFPCGFVDVYFSKTTPRRHICPEVSVVWFLNSISSSLYRPNIWGPRRAYLWKDLMPKCLLTM
jgi:hypothetical protein